jgi:hypothetical protein
VKTDEQLTAQHDITEMRFSLFLNNPHRLAARSRSAQSQTPAITKPDTRQRKTPGGDRRVAMHCSSPPARPSMAAAGRSPTPSSSEYRARPPVAGDDVVVGQHYAALQTGDDDAARDCFTGDVVSHLPGHSPLAGD